MNLNLYLEREKRLIDKALDKRLPPLEEYPPLIHKAMRYSLFPGGKRIRPVLLLASCRLCGGKLEDALPAACAIELIHSYSLIHDDLPALDNDDYRRGKLSCHKKFGEAPAVLTGDALLTYAFSVLSRSKRAKRVIREISQAIGTRGMLGGQVVDILKDKKEAQRRKGAKAQRIPETPREIQRISGTQSSKFHRNFRGKSQESKIPLPAKATKNGRTSIDTRTLEYIHTHKTGALIAISVKAGAIVAGAKESQINKLFSFGRHIGFAFQLIDDLKDREGYYFLLGAKKAKQKAEKLILQAKQELSPFGRRAAKLKSLADYILQG